MPLPPGAMDGEDELNLKSMDEMRVFSGTHFDIASENDRKDYSDRYYAKPPVASLL